MAITAAEIQNVSFSIDRKGYDVDEVDVFLEHVAEEIDGLNKLVAELQEAAAQAAQAPEPDAEQEGAPAADSDAQSAEIAELKATIDDLQAKLAEKGVNDAAISQALIVAQRSADEVLANARAEASNIIKDADEEADRIIGKAESDRLKIAEAIRTLETDRADVRAEYREMLSNFMADAQKKLAEIDGDTRRAAVTAQARNDANIAGYAPGVMAVNDPLAPQTAMPASAIPSSSIPVATPSASGFIDKDFSGYGAADDAFEFDID